MFVFVFFQLGIVVIMGDKSKYRSIGSLETWEPEDKSFSKHTLQGGEGDNPNEGSVCVVNMTYVGQYLLRP